MEELYLSETIIAIPLQAVPLPKILYHSKVKYWRQDLSVSSCKPSFSVPTLGCPIHSSLRSQRSSDRILVVARFSAHVQTGPGSHHASCTMGTGSFPGLKRLEHDVTHPPPPLAEVNKGVEL
jgi:hypothetical protein